MAVEEAMKDQTVAMVSSGDSGIYGMAGIIYQVAEEMGAEIEIETVPGRDGGQRGSLRPGSAADA